MKYLKPDLEELDLVLEGSYLQAKSPNNGTGSDKDPDEVGPGGDENPDSPWG